MKKSLFFSLVLIFAIVSLSFAQEKSNVKISWGEDYEIPKSHEDIGFFGNPTDGYVGISHKRGSDLTVQHFSPDLKLTNESSVSIKNLPKNYMIEKIMLLGGTYYLFYSTYDDDEMLWVQELDVKNGLLKDKARQIASSSNKIAGRLVPTGMYQVQTADKWKFLTSADESKLLIYYRLKPKEKRDALNNDVIGFCVFDDKLNKLWNKEVAMPYTEKMMDNDDYQVDQLGNAYILGKVFEEGNKESKNDHPNYHYELLVYSDGPDKKITAKFDIGEKYVVDAALIEDKKGRIICAGYYSQSKKARSTDGVFFMTFDEGSKSMKSIYKGFYEFPNEVIKQFESKRVQKKADKDDENGKDEEIANLEFRNLVVDDDGGFSLFGEQYHQNSTSRAVSTMQYTTTPGPTYGAGAGTFAGGMNHSTMVNTGSVSTTRYFYDDIYAMHINANGELGWVKKIPKRQIDISQTSTGYTGGIMSFRANTEFMSFFLHTIGKNNYLFFVDNQDNFDIKPDELPAVYKSGTRGEFICVKIDEAGNTTKTSIFDFKDEKMKILINKLNSVTADKIIGRARMTKGGLFQFNFAEGKPLMITVD